MTLAELLPEVQQLPVVDKLRLIRILAEDLDPSRDASSLLQPRVYELPTPYGVYGVAEALLEAVKSSQVDS